MRNGLKNPRGQKHVAEAIKQIRRGGGDNVQVTQNGHVQVSWTVDDQPLAISLPVKAHGGAVKAVAQMVRRALRSVNIEMRA